jgi:hypothetical protein
MHTKSDLQSAHVVDLPRKCQASESVDRGVGDPKPLLVVVLDRQRVGREGHSALVELTTPTTVTRIITARNENEPDERGLISGCRV